MFVLDNAFKLYISLDLPPAQALNKDAQESLSNEHLPKKRCSCKLGL